MWDCGLNVTYPACYPICRYWLVSLILQSLGSSRREYLDEDPSGNKVLRSYIGHPHLESKIKPTHPPMKWSKVLTKYTYQNTELGNTFSRSLALKTAKYVFFSNVKPSEWLFFWKTIFIGCHLIPSDFNLVLLNPYCLSSYLEIFQIIMINFKLCSRSFDLFWDLFWHVFNTFPEILSANAQDMLRII